MFCTPVRRIILAALSVEPSRGYFPSRAVPEVLSSIIPTTLIPKKEFVAE